MSALKYFDIIILAVATPIMLLIGVPAVGYCVAAGVWIALRAAELGVERLLKRADPKLDIGIRLGTMMGRLFVLALTVVLIRKGSGKDDGIAALAVVVFAFTVHMATSAITRPRSR